MKSGPGSLPSTGRPTLAIRWLPQTTTGTIGTPVSRDSAATPGISERTV